MVIPGSRYQGTGIRIISFFFIGISSLNTVIAKDCGMHGVIYPIEEQDPIALIQQKLKTMEDRGELKQRNLELQKHARASVERPKSVKGISRALKTRVFTYDPTYEVKDDLYDHQGRIFAKKGSKINPLETINLSQNLLFFDGDDSEQWVWVKEQLAAKEKKNESLKLILVRGAPLELAEELGIPVYFDQNGVLTKKIGVQYVPAVVSQDNLHLRIEEVILSTSKNSFIEGGV
ncbi:MAG: type-F conjugative transfer system protein TraW [Bacillota bacterium]|nr:type-F conjugative transfer system protein TraW [Bacillota bacterium]